LKNIEKSTNHKPKVLVVDDELEICISLELVLEDEYEVHYHQNPETALADVEQLRPDLVFLDINMPTMNGLEVLRRLNEMNDIHSVIMISANDNVEYAVEAMKNGAYDYLVKPWTVEDVIIRSSKALEKRQLIIQNQYYQQHLEEEVAKKSHDLMVAYSLLKKANLETIKVLSEAIEAKDRYTQGHCSRVSCYACDLGADMGMSQEELESLMAGALLHDIGKLGIKEDILNKNGPLDPFEWLEVQAHPVVGAKIVKGIEYLTAAAEIIRHHHERWDGGGYPDGKKGVVIPTSARIVGIADAFDALTSERPYRPAKPQDEALAVMRENRGTQFDPEILDLFTEIVEAQ